MRKLIKMTSVIIRFVAFLFIVEGCGIVLQGDTIYIKEKPKLYLVHNPSEYSIYYDGLWDDWHKMESSYRVKLRQQTEYNYFDIYIYHDFNHPSSFDYKITINYSSYKGLDDGWHEYDGWIEISETCTDAKYSKLKDNGKTIPVVLRLDEKMKESLKQGGFYGTINCFYKGRRGEGRAFNFYKRQNS